MPIGHFLERVFLQLLDIYYVSVAAGFGTLEEIFSWESQRPGTYGVVPSIHKLGLKGMYYLHQ